MTTNADSTEPAEGADSKAEPDPLPSANRWVARQARRYEESDGTEGTTLDGSPCLLLDTLGRRSGQWRRTVLVHAPDARDFLVVASAGGADADPLWYRNLLDHPEVRVRVGRDRFTARAEVLSAEEKERVWPGLVATYAPFAEYQAATTRDIPVVRLRRAGGV